MLRALSVAAGAARLRTTARCPYTVHKALTAKQPYLLCSDHQCHIDAPRWSYILSKALNLLQSDSPCRATEPLFHIFAVFLSQLLSLPAFYTSFIYFV